MSSVPRQPEGIPSGGGSATHLHAEGEHPGRRSANLTLLKGTVGAPASDKGISATDFDASAIREDGTIIKVGHYVNAASRTTVQASLRSSCPPPRAPRP